MFFDLFKKRVSVKTVGRARILYRDGKRKMYVLFEWVTPDGATEVDTFSVKHWEPPYDQEVITEEEKQKILSNIKNKLEEQGVTVRFY